MAVGATLVGECRAAHEGAVVIAAAWLGAARAILDSFLQ